MAREALMKRLLLILAMIPNKTQTLANNTVGKTNSGRPVTSIIFKERRAMLFKKFQQLAQWVGFLAIAALALYGLVNLGSGRLWAAGAESRTAATDAPQVTIPSTFNYQGFLRDGQGNPMGGTHKITLKLWQDVLATDVPALHTEDFPAVAVRDGLFNVVIGSLTVLDTNLFVNNVPLFVGVSVDDGAELLPRQRIHPVPWAILATNAQNAVNATTAGTATTLVPDAAVPGLNVTSSQRTGNANGTHIYIDQDDIMARNGNSTARLDLNYSGGDVQIGDFNSNVNIRGRLTAESINGETPPMVFTVGMNTNTTQYWTTGAVDIGPLCGDADGCTMRFLFRIKSTDEIRVIEETIFIEQPGESGNKNAGLHGYSFQQGGGTAGFVLNTAGKFVIVPDPWNWMRVRNHTQIVDGIVADGPVLSGYNVTFMTVPDVAATVIIYDR